MTRIPRPLSRRGWLGPLALVALAAACGEPDDPETPEAADPAVDEAAAPQDRFWTSLEELCGQAFRGRATEVQAVETDFSDEMIMHVRECREGEIRIPLHVGENRSRTWILTRTADGLRLKHDHRFEDGSEEEVTQYGGDTTDPGTATRQEFPADRFTAELLPEAATNVWTIEVQPGERFTYQLRREGTDRRVRFDFDLNDPVDPPPAPWGHEDRAPTH
jgi:hypothetical protein